MPYNTLIYTKDLMDDSFIANGVIALILTVFVSIIFLSIVAAFVSIL